MEEKKKKKKKKQPKFHLSFKVAYAQDKVNFWISVWTLFFFFCMTLIWIHKILLTWNLFGITWASVETCQFLRNAMYAYLLDSCFIYRHVQTVILYQNKLYIFSIVGLDI